MKLLKELDPRFKETLVVVSCSQCHMTMWANSDQAFVDKDNNIVCNSCQTGELK